MVACGGEVTGSMLLNEMAGFSIREAQFRKKMEKFKAAQSKDIVFEVSILLEVYLTNNVLYSLFWIILWVVDVI